MQLLEFKDADGGGTSIDAITLNADGSRLAVMTGYGKAISVIDMRTGKTLRAITQMPQGSESFAGMQWCPDGRGLFARSVKEDAQSGSYSAALSLLAVESGQKEETIEGYAGAFSPDGLRLAVLEANALRVYEAQSHALLCELPLSEMTRGQAWINAAKVRWSPDGKLISSVGELPGDANVNGEAYFLWETETGSVLELPGKVDAFSPDSRYCVTGNTVYDCATGKAVLTVPGSGTLLSPISFSPDGGCLIAAADASGSALLTPFLSLEEYCSAAREIIKGRALTDRERQRFFLGADD
jgi:WD40 repeat protein